MARVGNVRLELQNVHWSKVEQNDIPDENYNKVVRTTRSRALERFKLKVGRNQYLEALS